MATPNHPPRYALRSGATTNEHHEAVDESDDSFDEMAESPESPTPAPRSTVRRKLEGATGKSGGIKKASSKQPASNSKAINKGSNNTTSNKQSGSKKTGTKRELVPTPKTNKDKKAAESEAITTPNSSNKRVRRVLFPDAPSSGPRTRPFPSAPGSRESVRRQIAAQVSSPIGVYLESSRGVWNADQPAALNYTSRVNGLPRVPGPANPSPFGVVRNLSGLPTVGPGGGISFFSHRSMTPTEPPISDSHWGRSGRPDPAAFDHFEDEDEDDIDAPCDEDALPAPVSHARWDGTRLVWDGEDGGGGPVAAALSARPSLAGNNAPSRGFVSSSAIDPGNPYATFLRSMGGGVPAVTKTWGQQTRHPAYLPGLVVSPTPLAAARFSAARFALPETGPSPGNHPAGGASCSSETVDPATTGSSQVNVGLDDSSIDPALLALPHALPPDQSFPPIPPRPSPVPDSSPFSAPSFAPLSAPLPAQHQQRPLTQPSICASRLASLHRSDLSVLRALQRAGQICLPRDPDLAADRSDRAKSTARESRESGDESQEDVKSDKSAPLHHSRGPHHSRGFHHFRGSQHSRDSHPLRDHRVSQDPRGYHESHEFRRAKQSRASQESQEPRESQQPQEPRQPEKTLEYSTMADRAGEPYNMPPYPGGPRMPDIDEENDQDSVEYQLLQLKAYEYAQSDNANNTRLSSLHGLPGGAQHSAPGYNHHLGETQTDIEALSRMAHVNSASEPTEYTRPSTDPSEHGYLPAPNPNGAIPAHNPNRNDGAMPAPNPIIIDSDDSDPGRPLPHMPPAIDSLDVYNPSINPAAGYWNHPGFPLHPPIPFSQPLPSFDTDPYLPFAPWRVSILRPFHPETTNRMILAPQRYLHVLGHLYPSALFALARYPVSQNPVLRLTGTALLDSIRLHHPQMLSAEMLDVVHRAGAEARDEMYLVRLHTRDWPIGGVALMPNSEDAMRFVESIKGSFDVLGGGQEVFYYRACDVVLKSGRDGKRKGIWVCRAYEGRQGPQDDVIVGEWLAAGGVRGVLGEEEAEEREVMVRMGEVMEEKAPVRGRRA